MLSDLTWCRVRLKPDGTRWRTGGEVKGKVANGVGSQYSHTTSERGVSSITNADAHTSATSCRLNWRPADLNGLVPFGERRNLVSARVPSRFKALYYPCTYTYVEWPQQTLNSDLLNLIQQCFTLHRDAQDFTVNLLGNGFHLSYLGMYDSWELCLKMRLLEIIKAYWLHGISHNYCVVTGINFCTFNWFSQILFLHTSRLRNKFFQFSDDLRTRNMLTVE